MTKVLLVDDEETFRKALAKRLNLHGIEAIDVNCGEDAIKRVRQDDDVDVSCCSI